ncbi:hypothetical protein [Synechococcus sp. PCC 7336]|uniref:hypothetical protein n=1 Tax=Synechococcus sp. PCC 7336 TaxID=195250 RepID=UPI00034CF757|nr:hypothetical protein [Synechococcus sp. PCC 7336]
MSLNTTVLNTTLEAELQHATELERAVLVSVLSAMQRARNNPTRLQFLQRTIDVSLKASQQTKLTPEFLQQSEDFDVMVQGITQPEVLKALAPEDPLAAARLKGHRVKLELLYRDGDPLSSAEVAQLLCISRQAVDKRRKKHQLLAVSLGRRGYFYPAEQFLDGSTLPGLEKVLAALQEYSAWTQLMFLKTADVRLEGKTPLECLKAGQVEAVVQAAQCYGDQSAA